MVKRDTPTGLSPSADTPPQKKRRVLAGRAAVLLIAGVAVAAFALYLLIIVFGLMTGT